MTLPVMPSTHRWFRGGPGLSKVGRNALFASDDTSVWVWDEETGNPVTDLLDETGAAVSAPRLSDGWLLGAGLPNAVRVASFSLGKNGKRYEMVPVQTLIDAAASLTPTDTQVASLLGNPASSTRTQSDNLYTAKQSAGKGVARFVLRSDYASFTAAKTAAGSGGTVWYDQPFNENNQTIDIPLTIDGPPKTKITKNANGPIFTVTAASVKIGAGLILDGNGSTYTGPGVVVTGNGTTADFVLDGDVINCQQWAVDFGIGAGQRAVIGKGLVYTRNSATNDAAMTAGSNVLTSATANFTAADIGKYALVRGAYSAAQPTWYLCSLITGVTSATQVTLADNANVTVSAAALEYHYPAIRFGAEYGAGVVGDRHIIGTHTGGFLLADIGGAQTVSIVGTNSRGVVFSSSSCAKISLSGANRLATSGAPIIVHGTNHSIVGATMAGDLILDTDSNNCTAGGNVLGSLENRNNTNTILGGRADSHAPVTVDPATLAAASALNANQAIYMRARGSGWVSKIGLHVGTSSGNICVGVYTNTGQGSSATPAARKATTGSVACPAAGYAEVALTSSVWVADGDWIALVADNATATFYRGATNGFSSSLSKGRSAFQNTAFPLPATATPSTGAIFSAFLLGVV